MKKMMIIMVMALVSELTFSQTYLPIQTYNESGYTVAEVKKFALGSTELSMNWRIEFVKILNAGLKASGENLIINQSCISSALDYVKDSAVTLKDFTNSGRVGNTINLFVDHRTFTGIVGVFQYGKCRLIVYKTICMNLLKVPVQIIFTQTIIPTAVVQQKQLVQTKSVVNDTFVSPDTTKKRVDVQQQSQTRQSNGNNTFTVTTGCTFTPNQQQPQVQPKSGNYGNNTFTVTTGCTFTPNQQQPQQPQVGYVCYQSYPHQSSSQPNNTGHGSMSNGTGNHGSMSGGRH